MTVEIGSVLGDYRILSQIGAGAYAEVFEAEHVITRRIEAVKILCGGPHAPEDEQRFLREIQVQASLHHPNIAAVHNAFSTPHGLALVMERVKGQSLRAILDRGRVPLAQGIGYISGTLSALIYAEMRGVVHRDIKPENIMVTEDGSVKLTDFGLAQSRTSPRLTQAGMFAGSPSYMSPEQARAEGPVDRRSDIYSTGVVLYEIVTGRPPFTDRNGYAVMLAHQNTAPTPPIEVEPAVGEKLNQVILKALEKEPEQRFQNALEFHAALKNALAGAPQTARPAEGIPPRKRMAVAAGVLAAGCLGATAAYVQHKPAPVVAPPPVIAAEPASPKPTGPGEIPTPPSEPPPRAPEPKPATAAASLRPSQKRTVTTAVPSQASPPAPLVAACGASETASVPQCPGPAPTATPLAASMADPAVPETAEEPTAKKRNVVVRSLGKVFGKFKHKPEASPAESFADAPDSAPR